MPAIPRLQKQSTLNSAINGMREYILDNKLRPGDRLPTENELSEGLGVSRNIIRESMQYFRAAGIVETKQKVGAVIGKFIPEDPFKSYLPFLANDVNCLKEAAQIRMVLECGAAPFMVENCSDEDITKLKDLIDGLKNESVRMEFDIQFHSILLHMTKNRFIESMIPLTVDFFIRNTDKLSDKHFMDLKRIVKEHRLIVEALEERSSAKLEAALKAHYKLYFAKSRKAS